MSWRVSSELLARAAPGLPPRWLRLLAGNLVVGLGYYGLAELGGVVQFTGQVQVAWLPVGFAAAMLYLGDLRWFAGGMVSDLLLGTGVYPFHYQLIPTAQVSFQTFGNTVEFTLTAYLMRRYLGRGSRLDRPFDVATMLLSLIAGVTISAVVGAVSTWLDHGVSASGIWTVGYTWWLGDMSGGLLVAPLLLVWAQRPAPGHELRFGWRTASRAVGILGLVVALSIVAFSQPYPLPYIVFPALMLAAINLGLPGATAALACALAVAIGMTAARTAPFAQQSITTEVLSTQLYILTATLTTLTLGAAVRARRQAGLELAQARLRAADQAERERQRIARDLHDSVSQTLFSLGLHAGIARHEVARAELPAGSALPDAVAEVAGLAQAALLEMRASIFDLRGGAVAEQGLVTALAAHGAALTVRHDVQVTVTGPEDRLPLTPRAEELLFRIGQEAVTNAVKHSGSPAVSATVSAGEGQAGGRRAGGRPAGDGRGDGRPAGDGRAGEGQAGGREGEGQRDGGQVTLTICDQGSGFDPSTPYAGHLGLDLMRSRAAEAGGTISIASAPGAGTTVRVTVPAR